MPELEPQLAPTVCTKYSAGLESGPVVKPQIVPSACTCSVSPFHRRAAPAW